jgi:type II secretory pathway pseudopilin PulG
MIEMLGVLAIVGVLSVGALSGYSMAMERYKASKAIDEIQRIIFEIKDLFGDKEKYTGVWNTSLKRAGILNSDATNIYNLPIVTSDGFSSPYWIFTVLYDVPDDFACKKIMLAGWDTELGTDMVRLGVSTNEGNLTYYYQGHFPLSIAQVNAVCIDAKRVIFGVH